MPSKTIFDPLDFQLVQYKLDCSDEVNQYLIDYAYKLDTFAQNNEIDGMNPRGTKYNQDKESYIGAHTPPFNRCHMFPGFPQIF